MKFYILKKDEIDIKEYENMIKNLGFSIDYENPDFILAFGGDGTILRALKTALDLNIPIIPVNFGKLGYMAHIEKDELKDLLINIKKGIYNTSKRYVLECEIENKKYYALNDIVFKDEHVKEYKLFDSDYSITKYRGDGLIISTSTGSTAYAMSAGGSIINPELKIMNIVAIAPQTLSARPLILPPTNLKIKSDSKIYVDGIKVLDNKKCETKINLSDKYVELIESQTKTYYDILKYKLEWRGYK
ncbi:NAD(+)/NADH kinase [Caviibacter abscessus]|uniref:NAD(+)/NADH kinase n=1 Tax=Caviibacter abscessus TaxID=1766719 RepID=UPI00082ECC50|nr:NAD(+)/NADH kinase [Caviibacter abscessus]